MSPQADMMTHQQLMRVYGALMWSLARILQNPEVIKLHEILDLHSIMSSCVQVCRIYVGSFWNQPLQYTGNRCNPFSLFSLSKVILDI